MTTKAKKKFNCSIAADRCKACGFCRATCPQGVFDLGSEYNKHGYQNMQVVKGDACIGCLRCLHICPDFAITISEDSAE